MEFVGCSYGHAIFADLSVSETGGNITMIDVFTSVQVSPPPCPKLAEAATYYMLDFIDLLCCTLTATISSPKACLLVSTSDIVGRLLVWRIGSDDWQDATTDHDNLGPIYQIVVFKDKIIALDIDLSLYTVHLDDDAQLGMSIRPLLIVEEDNDGMVNNEALLNPRLVVVCGDKLALVASPSPDWESLVFFHLDGLDSPTEPPRWSPVPELDGAVFISGAMESRRSSRVGMEGGCSPEPAWRGGEGGEAVSPSPAMPTKCTRSLAGRCCPAGCRPACSPWMVSHRRAFRFVCYLLDRLIRSLMLCLD
jgi:hypothetical protein